MTWIEANKWEAGWWGDCLNTINEDLKQVQLYAPRMGLQVYHDSKTPYAVRCGGVSVLDVGGGPSSLLLKCTDRGRAAIIDPLPVPAWVLGRYGDAGIAYHQLRAECMTEDGWDEVWCYNCLQHVEDPALVIQRMRAAGRIVRLFEWVDTVANVGHPHTLQAGQLDEWLGGEGRTEKVPGGTCYYGIFWGETCKR